MSVAGLHPPLRRLGFRSENQMMFVNTVHVLGWTSKNVTRTNRRRRPTSMSTTERGTVRVTFWPEGASVEAKPGEIVADIARRAGVEVTISCGVGDCGTCEMELIDRTDTSGCKFYVKTCVTKVSERTKHMELGTVGYDYPVW
mmetsp:Transcript_3701/g.7086  ORF Transcript_3701/g.7086 Transcript_3701/m.7086 type:complete len:143 (-) Transcript_3701:1182-1610(-)